MQDYNELNNSNQSNNEVGWPTKLIIALLVLTAIIMIIVLAVKYFSPKNTVQLGELKATEYMRVGESQQIVLDTQKTVLKDNTDIVWYIDDNIVSQYKYVSGTNIALDYLPMSVGIHQIKVNVGKQYMQSIAITVDKPVLTITVPNAECIYGEQLPVVNYTISGLIDGYGDKPTYQGLAVIDGQYNGVGSYTLVPLDNIQNEEYEIQINKGQLIVHPKALRVTAGDTLTKVYDGNTLLNSQWLELQGVIAGDEVALDNHILYFLDKNVGDNKLLDMSSLVLIGEDSDNYYIDSTKQLTGSITPKTVSIVGISANDKNYDGTDNVDLQDVGSLVGVIEGDKVAIGTMEAKFQDAGSGKGRMVVISNITLVGKDKGNYVVDSVNQVKANVFINYMNILLNRPNVIQGNNK